MLKNIFEWKRDQNYVIARLNQDEPEQTMMQTVYDEDLIQDQINDWINKLLGLCDAVPTEDRPELAETIARVIIEKLR